MALSASKLTNLWSEVTITCISIASLIGIFGYQIQEGGIWDNHDPPNHDPPLKLDKGKDKDLVWLLFLLPEGRRCLHPRLRTTMAYLMLPEYAYLGRSLVGSCIIPDQMETSQAPNHSWSAGSNCNERGWWKDLYTEGRGAGKMKRGHKSVRG